MLIPMRSFTLASGFWLSSLATTSATHPSVTLFKRTSGVCPISSVTSLAIFIISSFEKRRDAESRRPSLRVPNLTNLVGPGAVLPVATPLFVDRFLPYFRQKTRQQADITSIDSALWLMSALHNKGNIFRERRPNSKIKRLLAIVFSMSCLNNHKKSRSIQLLLVFVLSMVLVFRAYQGVFGSGCKLSLLSQ